jgi:hypothetical protein
VAVAYDFPTTGHTFILCFHQVMHVPTLTRHLINPFQISNCGIKINETPLMHLTADQQTPEILLHIPLSFDRGMMSGFTSRIPTDEEIQDYDQNFTTHIVMTSPTEWKPWSKEWERIESALRAQLTSDFDLRHTKFKESSEAFPVQLRGQDTTTPTEEGNKEFQSVLHWEEFAGKQRREVSVIHVQEQEELLRPLFGGEFGDVSALDFDLDQLHFKRENRAMQPWSVSSSVSDLDEQLA